MESAEMEILVQMSDIAQRKGSEWYSFRKWIPEDVRQHPDFNGRREIWKALKTKDPLLAKQRAEPLSREWDAKIERAKAGMAAGGQPTARATEIAEAYIKKCVRGHDLHTLEVENETKLIPFLEALGGDGSNQGGLLNKEHPKMSTLVRLVSNKDISPFDWKDIKPLVFDLDARSAGQLVLGMATIARDALLDEFAFKAPVGHTPALHSKIAQQVIEQDENPPKPFLSEILKAVIAVDEDRKGRFSNHVESLIEWCGDKPCDQYSFEDLLDYRNKCLSRLPDTRKAKYKGMTSPEAVKAADPADLLAPKTRGNHLSSIITTFDYARRKHHFFLDLKDLRPKKEKGRKRKVSDERFTQEELQGMVNLLPTVKDSPVRFWVTLIALYQGCRLDEAAQLHAEDVRKEDGLWIFDFNEDDPERTKKHIKKEVSVRVVPVHPTLIKLGFASFVEKRKEELQGSSALLFKDARWIKGHDYNRPVGRWFNEGGDKFNKGKGALKKQFLTPERAKYMYFYRLRHTWTQQAQNQARMDDKKLKELKGHTSDTESARSYRDINEPPILLDELQKLDYGLDLSPIMGLY